MRLAEDIRYSGSGGSKAGRMAGRQSWSCVSPRSGFLRMEELMQLHCMCRPAAWCPSHFNVKLP